MEQDKKDQIVDLMTKRNEYVLRLTEHNAQLLKLTQIYSGYQVEHQFELEKSAQQDQAPASHETLEAIKQKIREAETSIEKEEAKVQTLEHELMLIDQKLADLT